MSVNIAETFELLFDKNNNEADNQNEKSGLCYGKRAEKKRFI